MGKNQSKPEEVEPQIIIQKEYVPIPEKNIQLVKANSMEFETLKEEEEFLMKHKNEVLQTQLNQVRKKFEKVDSLDQVIDFKEKEDEEISNKFLLEIADDEKYCLCQYKTYLKVNFNIIGILFVVSNLIAVYQLIGILKATEKEISFGIQSFLFEKNRTATDNNNTNNTNSTIPLNLTENSNNTENNNTQSQTFENIFESYSFKTIPDFNLLYISSILGNLLLKLFGFRISTIIYMILNVLALFFFDSFDFPEKYNFYQILLLIGYYIIFFISVGGISLLSLQIYFDGLTKYIHYLESHEKPKLNINIIEEEKNNKEQNILIDNVDNINNKDKKDEEKKDKISFFTYLCLTEIPAYLISFGINYFFVGNNYYDYFFLINVIIFLSFTIFSLIFYCCYSSIFVKKEKKEQKKTEINVWRILGYLIYYEKKYQEVEGGNESNDIIENEENKENAKYYKAPCCYSCRLGHRKCRYKSKSSFFTDFCCGVCGLLYSCFYFCCCICCCFAYDDYEKCCNEKDLSEVNQGDEQFCFCYKVQGKYSWFCDLLFKNDVLSYIEFDILLELITIGFNKKINENLKENDFNHNFIVLILYLVFFIIFASLNRFESKEFRESIKSSFMKMTHSGEVEIYRQQGNVSIILLVNIFFVIIFSGFSYFGSESLKNFTDNYLIIFPFALTKFYNFILLNCLINIIDYGNIDLLSNSTIVSLFLLLYKLVAFIFTDVIDCSADGLILFQFILCMIFVGIFIVILCFVGLCWAIFKLLCICCYPDKK